MNFATFIGQESLKRAFNARILLASETGASIPHVLLCGPPEMGKVTFAKAVAGEMHVSALTSETPISKKLDLVGVLSNTAINDVVVLPNIESLNDDVSDMLVQAVSDRRMDILLGVGPLARSVAMDVNPFTLIGTTSKPWQIPASFRRWFIPMDFEPYSLEEMAQLLVRLAEQSGIAIDQNAGVLLATACKGIPGNALTLLKRIDQHYKAYASVSITTEVAEALLFLLGYTHTEDRSVTLADRLRVMSGLEFEQFVGSIFRRAGYSTELTPTSGDHGIDILIRKGAESGAVQCKRWTDSVGEPVVREFLGSIKGAGLGLGFIAITSTFTESATAFARAHAIRLLDLDAIIQMATSPEPNLFLDPF
jgi:Holliday junction resolvasome RuvABC ATP-dependent DNA helicase subunit